MTHEDAQQLIAAVHSLKLMLIPAAMFIFAVGLPIVITLSSVVSAIRELSGRQERK